MTHKNIPLSHEKLISSYWSAIQPDYKHQLYAFPRQCDILIIGAGYTGLNAALTLASEYNQSVTVLDAGSIGAGCSSRNAGFVLPGTGRLSFQDYQSKFGVDTARAVQDEFALSVNRVKALCESAPASVQLNEARYLKLAHRKHLSQKLEAQVSQYSDTLLNANWIDPKTLQQQLPGVNNMHGGISFTPAMSLNPKAYVNHLARLCDKANVHMHSQIAMSHYEQRRHDIAVHTNKGIVHAKKLLLCTNGYLPKGASPELRSKHLPVLSSVLVTEPLNPSEVEAIGLSTSDLVMDTRKLKYYYRLLPDNRLLFGGRGAISGKNAAHPKYASHLLKALKHSLPALKGIKAEYHWHGWISVSLDSMPRVFSPTPGVYTAMGYCGAGIAFSNLAGKRLAQLSMDEPLPELPFYQSALPTFPAPAMRRLGQWLYYQYGQLVD
ncbi:FAD-binding oxidoreductase [Lysobacter sp. N42]|uniref:NAD(P)/FAD-dependent oxidoreductase n=1 Tax=Lysobacter sp. N42 TaxID=2545719 RepID=UPI001404E6E2|nr:FAD-binding oxidoreductase [Lysobacter sp. N42]